MNKSVFITGAHNNTGYGIAELFASNGWDVFVTSRRKEDAEKAADKLSAKYGIFAKGYECNIRNEQQIIDIFNDIDKTERTVETVVLNAANMGFNPKDPAGGTGLLDGTRKRFSRGVRNQPCLEFYDNPPGGDTYA